MDIRQATYLFVDAGYARAALESLLRRLGLSPPPTYAWASLRSLWLSERAIDRIFYYDAPPARRAGESEEGYQCRQAAFFQQIAYLSKLDSFFCRTGHVKGIGKRARQKAVDIQIAVDMMSHSVRGNMTEAILFSGDLDFEPVVAALVSLGTRVTIWAESSSASEDLLGAADQQRILTPEHAVRFLPSELAQYYRLYGKGKKSESRVKHDEIYKFETLVRFSTLPEQHELAIDIGRTSSSGSGMSKGERIFQVSKKVRPSSSESQEEYWMHHDLRYLLAFVAADLNVRLPESLFESVIPPKDEGNRMLG